LKEKYHEKLLGNSTKEYLQRTHIFYRKDNAGLTPYPDQEWVNEQAQLLLPSLNDVGRLKRY